VGDGAGQAVARVGEEEIADDGDAQGTAELLGGGEDAAGAPCEVLGYRGEDDAAKMVRQPQPNRSQSVSTPPSSTPAAFATPAVTPNRATTLPPSAASNMARSEPSTCGSRAAVATPCTARAAIK
jgi:hypothetical protein